MMTRKSQQLIAFLLLSFMLFFMLSSIAYCEEIIVNNTVRHVPVKDITPLLLKAFEDAYGKEKLSQIIYEYLLFSPKGNFLAISISQITSGDPEQVWIIDLRSNKVRLITERVIKGRVGVRILNLSWESEGTLLATIKRTNWLNHFNNRVISVRATIDESEETIISYIWKKETSFVSPSNRYEVRSSWSQNEGNEVIDLKTGKVLLRDREHNWERVTWVNDVFFIFVVGYGHGSFSLMAGMTKPKATIFSIDSGNWELFHYVVNPTSPQIAYPTYFHSNRNYAIVFYDMNKKAIIKTIFARNLPKSMAWSSDNQIAFSAKSCEIATEKFDNPALDTEESITKLCVFQLKDGT